MILSQNWYLQTSKGCNSKNTYSRVMVLALCMSSVGALYLYEVL